MVKVLTSAALLKKHKLTSKWFPKRLRTARMIERDEMVVQIKELQVTSASLLSRLQDGSGDENTYNSHSTQTIELISKYQAKAEYGSTLVKRLVNVAASLQIPNGVELEGKDTDAEYAYLKTFIEVNQLNEGVAIQLAKEAQFHGQVLVTLKWDPEKNMVKIYYMPWSEYDYKVQPIGLSNLTGPYKITWGEDEDQKSLEGIDIAFVAFNVVHDGVHIEGFPTLGGLLMRIEAVSKDLIDWRTSNKLYAHPTPIFTCETQSEVDDLTSTLTSEGWTVGTAIAFRGKFVLAAAPNYHKTIVDSIETNVKLISGGSGVAISWLGFADVMSNRATAESLGEPLEIVAASDMATWRSFYEELFDNVITFRNNNIDSEQVLKTGMVKPKLKPMTDRQWKKLKDIFLPAAKSNLLTREGFLDEIPGFDLKKELDRIEEQEEEANIDLDQTEEVEVEFEEE